MICFQRRLLYRTLETQHLLRPQGMRVSKKSGLRKNLVVNPHNRVTFSEHSSCWRRTLGGETPHNRQIFTSKEKGIHLTMELSEDTDNQLPTSPKIDKQNSERS